MRLPVILVLLSWMFLLAGCSSVPADAGRSAPCCAALEQLDYRPLAANESLRVTLGADTARVAWPDGASPVAAFRLPATPRPLLVEVSSHLVSGPGLLEKIYLAPLLHRSASAFAPVLHLLDAQHRERRSLAIEGATKDCSGLHVGGDDRVATLVLPVSEPADEAAFLVIATNDTLRSRGGGKICGDTPLMWGDRADLRLRVRALPAGTGPVRLESMVDWRPRRREPSIVERALSEMHDRRSGWLVLDDHQLLYAEDTDPLRARLALPLERIVRATTTADDSLAVAVPDATGRGLEWHAFQFAGERRWREAIASDFSQALDSAIDADRLVQPLELSVPAWPAEVGFEVRPAARAPLSGPAKEIVDTATAAGIVTAMPCGLCSAGGCGPELLAPCAAAFAVGAVVGGVWATGRELLHGGLRAAPPGPAAPAPVDARAPARGQLSDAGAARFDAGTLGTCLLRAAGAPEPGWRMQGLHAPLRLLSDAPAPAAGTARVIVRIDVGSSRVDLQACKLEYSIVSPK